MMMTTIDDEKLCLFGLSFVVAVCVFVCARSSINKREATERLAATAALIRSPAYSDEDHLYLRLDHESHPEGS
jgi:hypothetical protein